MKEIGQLVNQSRTLYDRLNAVSEPGCAQKETLEKLYRESSEINREIQNHLRQGARIGKERVFERDSISASFIDYCFFQYGDERAGETVFSPFKMLAQIRKLHHQVRSRKGEQALTEYDEKLGERGTLLGGECLSVGTSLEGIYLLVKEHQGLFIPPALFRQSVRDPKNSGLLGEGEIGVHWRYALEERNEEFHLYFGNRMVERRVKNGFKKR